MRTVVFFLLPSLDASLAKVVHTGHNCDRILHDLCADWARQHFKHPFLGSLRRLWQMCIGSCFFFLLIWLSGEQTELIHSPFKFLQPFWSILKCLLITDNLLLLLVALSRLFLDLLNHTILFVQLSYLIQDFLSTGWELSGRIMLPKATKVGTIQFIPALLVLGSLDTIDDLGFLVDWEFYLWRLGRGWRGFSFDGRMRELASRIFELATVPKSAGPRLGSMLDRRSSGDVNFSTSFSLSAVHTECTQNFFYHNLILIAIKIITII